MGCASSKVSTDYNAGSLKTQLKLLDTRLDIRIQKQLNVAQQEKKNIAELLKTDSHGRARIMVEGVIRMDYELECFELLKQYINMLLPKLSVLEGDPGTATGEPNPQVAGSVFALMYGAWLYGEKFQEMRAAGKLLGDKYGRGLTKRVTSDRLAPARLLTLVDASQLIGKSEQMQKLAETYLMAIAESVGVTYVPTGIQSTPAPGAVSGSASVPTPSAPVVQGFVPEATEAKVEALVAALALPSFGTAPVPWQYVVIKAAQKLGVREEELGTGVLAQIDAAYARIVQA
jgi:hypothetical protein